MGFITATIVTSIRLRMREVADKTGKVLRQVSPEGVCPYPTVSLVALLFQHGRRILQAGIA